MHIPHQVTSLWKKEGFKRLHKIAHQCIREVIMMKDYSMINAKQVLPFKGFSLVCTALFIYLNTLIHVSAQPNIPRRSKLYNDKVVPTMKLYLSADSVDALYHPKNEDSDHEYPALFIFEHASGVDTLEQVGIRLQGNTSRNKDKKSFHLSFNTYQSGRKYDGVEKTNLKAEANDPSLLRQKINLLLAEKMNTPAALSNHVRLFINNFYCGLYHQIEFIDEEFAARRFGNNNGNLFKCLYPADLGYEGSSGNDYKSGGGANRAYALKTNETADDYNDLAHFIDVLNNTSAADFECAIEKVFNVDDYLKSLAIEIFSGHWDGYTYNQNNYYLYHNTETGRFEFILYDMDNTYGIDWFNKNWESRNIYSWASGGATRPLYKKMMATDAYRQRFTYYMRFLMDSVATDDFLEEVEQIRTRIEPAVKEDTFYPLDYGFALSDFKNALAGDPPYGYGGHVENGVFDFIKRRKSSARSQLETLDMSAVINYIDPDDKNGRLEFSAFVGDDKVGASVELVFTVNGGTMQSTPMYDDGRHADQLADDGIYGAILTELNNLDQVEFQVKATDSDDHMTLKPCQPLAIAFYATGEYLLINELLASNNQGLADEYGEHDDWIELYNATGHEVTTTHYYLTDSKSQKTKWPLPPATVGPGQYLFYWADGQPEQGESHTNFKLSASGETLRLYKVLGGDTLLADKVKFVSYKSDVSYGRTSDGDSTWSYFSTPTPDARNVNPDPPGTGIQAYDAPIAITVFPNPAQDYVTVSLPEQLKGILQGAIVDMQGRVIRPVAIEAGGLTTIDLTGLTPGMYLLYLQHHAHTVTRKILVGPY